MAKKTSIMQQSRPPRVAIICDVSTGYGREITLGATRFANLQREWELCTETIAGHAIDMLPRCDGAIVASGNPEVYDLVASRCERVVYCPVTLDVERRPVVSVDDRAVGALAAEHLIGCGLKNFAYYGFPESSAFDRRRYEGFSATLKSYGYACSTCKFPWPPWPNRLTHNHHPQLLEWIESLPMPLGVMGVTDMQAHDLAGACLTVQIPVPERVAIVGVDDDPLLCESAWPPITSVACDFKRVGYEAAKTLKRLLMKEKLHKEELWIHLPPRGITERQSTDIVAVTQPEVAEAIRYIREHACDPCTVKDILHVVPVGRRWLEMQFKQTLGRTPHDEINRVRMDVARRLLTQPDLSIVDIAERCGFTSAQTFSRAFSDAVGTTPATYRRKRT